MLENSSKIILSQILANGNGLVVTDVLAKIFDENYSVGIFKIYFVDVKVVRPVDGEKKKVQILMKDGREYKLECRNESKRNELIEIMNERRKG